jgi:nucleoside-diphosphate-sugar epimerase
VDKNIDTISILGCGWFGLPLAKELVKDGFTVNGSTTTPEKLTALKNEKINPYLINVEQDIFDKAFFNCDILLINIPPKRNDDINAYAHQIERIVKYVIACNVKNVVFISSTGVFEDGNFVVNETTIAKPNTISGKKLQKAEALLQQQTAFTTTIIRFAGLIGPERNLAKYFAGKNEIENGLAPINLIHLNDCIGLYKAIITQQKWGILYHGVAPSHPTRKDFYTALCESSAMPKPKFKNEKKDWKQIESLNIYEHLNYKFKITDWLLWAKDPDV